MTLKPLQVRRLGRLPFDAALDLQRTLVEERQRAHIPDTLLLLEHPHVLTLGVRKGGGRANILASSEVLAARGVAVHEAGRGGDVTYHGPGQLVGYPIIDLRPDRQDVHRYVRDLEAMLIGVCADFGVAAERLDGLSGAWVRHPQHGPEKIAAIGVRIARWVTSHGFALNVNTDLDFFRLIVPCGITDRGVTSLQRVVGHPLSLDRVSDAVVRQFGGLFAREAIDETVAMESSGR